MHRIHIKWNPEHEKFFIHTEMEENYELLKQH